MVVTLSMTGCFGSPVDDQTLDQPTAPADTQPAETEDKPESPTGDSAQDAAFRELVSSVPSEALKERDVQDYAISVVKSLCAQLDAGVPADETVDEVTSTIELTDDEFFTVVFSGVSTYCPQHEDALMSD